tara:strand:+ start:2638 stop:2934 length:297 start_codon:yes stop_codon:yes gene_type:complete
MSIRITEHACVRFIERAWGIGLNEFRDRNIKDSTILTMLDLDRFQLEKTIIGDTEKLEKILNVIGGNEATCTIGVSDTHKLVFKGYKVVTILPNKWKD